MSICIFIVIAYRLLAASEDGVIKQLPYELSPGSMNNLHGLRARVVRTLFTLHPPFTRRLLRVNVAHQDTDVLINLRCRLAWTQVHRSPSGKDVWNIYFKFRYQHMKRCEFVNKDPSKRTRDVFGPDDIHHNEEEGCYILQVSTESFVPIPLVMGQVLVQASVRIGSSMRYEKLELKFNQSCDSSARPGSSASHVLVVDPLWKLDIIPWWSPQYYTTQVICECE